MKGRRILRPNAGDARTTERQARRASMKGRRILRPNQARPVWQPFGSDASMKGRRILRPNAKQLELVRAVRGALQ